jgi:endonuclease/exonuclease/phosphatase family metal-dependent hydrolase
MAVQEARMLPDQIGWIARDVERRTAGALRYRVLRRGKTGLLRAWEGVGVLSRVPVVATSSLDLGANARVAQRVTVRPPEGGLLDVYTTHLGGPEALRLAQVRRILDWMDARPPIPAVLLGDFNSRPGSPTIDLVGSRLRSAYADVHGQEPPRTVPTPLHRRGTGPGSVLDFIFVNELLEVRDARVAFDRVDPTDPTLAASDHYGLMATVTACCSPASPDRPRR